MALAYRVIWPLRQQDVKKIVNATSRGNSTRTTLLLHLNGVTRDAMPKPSAKFEKLLPTILPIAMLGWSSRIAVMVDTRSGAAVPIEIKNISTMAEFMLNLRSMCRAESQKNFAPYIRKMNPMTKRNTT